MNSLEKLKSEYNDKQVYMNKNKLFCHSIDVDKYRILCKDFFDDETEKIEIALAEESLQSDTESQLIFENWLME